MTFIYGLPDFLLDSNQILPTSQLSIVFLYRRFLASSHKAFLFKKRCQKCAKVTTTVTSACEYSLYLLAVTLDGCDFVCLLCSWTLRFLLGEKEQSFFFSFFPLPLINNQVGFTAVFLSHFALDGNWQGIPMRLTSKMKKTGRNKHNEIINKLR